MATVNNIENNNNMSNSMLNKENTLSSSSAPAAPFTPAGGSSLASIPNAPVARNLGLKHNTTIQGKRLRLRDWGRVSEEGFSGFDRSFYYRARLPFERNVVLEELRSKHQPLNTQPASTSPRRSVPAGTFSPLPVDSYTTGFPITTGQAPIMTAPILSAPILSSPMLSAPILSSPMLSAPILSSPMLTTPTPLLATTVPVPMLNPPINDGRRYQKLYKQNAGGNYLNKIKSRGTRKDHLVQPAQPIIMSAPVTTTFIQQPVSYTTTIQQPVSYTTTIQQPVMMPMTTTALPIAGTMPLPATQNHGFMHRRAQQASKGEPQPVYSNIVQTGVPMM